MPDVAHDEHDKTVPAAAVVAGEVDDEQLASVAVNGSTRTSTDTLRNGATDAPIAHHSATPGVSSGAGNATKSIGEAAGAPDLLAQVARLQADLAACESRRIEELQTAAERISSLEGKLSHFTRTHAASPGASTNNGGGGDVAELNDRVASLIAEGEAMAKREADALLAARKHRARVGELESLIATSLKAVEKVDGQQQAAKRENAVLRDEKHALERRVKQLERIDGQLEQLQKTKIDLTTQNNELERHLKEARIGAAKAAQLAAKLDVEQARATTLEGRVTELLREAKSTAEESAAELAALQGKHDRLLERQVQTAREHSSDVARLESQLESMRARFEEGSAGDVAGTRLLRQIEQLQGQYAEAQQNWQHIEEALQRRVADAEQDRDRLTETEISLRKRLREDSRRMQDLEEDLAKLQSTAKQQERSLADYRDQLEAATTSLTATQAALDGERDSWIKEKDSIRQQHEIELRARLEDLRDQMISPSAHGPGSPSILTPDGGGGGGRAGRGSRSPELYRHPSQEGPFSPSAGASSYFPHGLPRPNLSSKRSMHFAQSRRDPVSRMPSGTSTYNYGGAGGYVQPQHRQDAVDEDASGDGAETDRDTLPAPTPRMGHSRNNSRTGGGGGGVLEYNGLGITSPPLQGNRYDPSAGFGVGGGVPGSVAGSASASGANVGLLERLAAQVRRLEAEQMLTREELSRVSAQRDDARQDCIALDSISTERDELKHSCAAMEAELALLRKRFDKTLELLGEQTEENEQLKEDISDMKQAYRVDMESRFAG